MNCPNCNARNVELATHPLQKIISAGHAEYCLRKGKVKYSKANYCELCGYDLRPYHDDIFLD